MNDAIGVLSDSLPMTTPPLTPESLNSLLKIAAPTGSVTVKGIASEVHYWKRKGDTRASRIYGRLSGLGDASIRFELQPYARIRDNECVVLHGALRLKPSEGFRTTHEVILVGDILGNWIPHDELQESGQRKEAAVPLVRRQPRMTLESVVARYGTDAIAFLATNTAWQDLTNAASAMLTLSNCRHVETSFMQCDRFIEDLRNVCGDPAIKVLVIARGGGPSLSVIGDSHEVASEILASGRAFYTALGHDKDVQLLDKHADQAFATPSVLGQTLAETIRTVAERDALVENVRMLSEFTDTLNRENIQLKSQLTSQSALVSGATAYTVREETSVYNASQHVPDVSSKPGRTNHRYALWALLIAIVFLVGRCSR